MRLAPLTFLTFLALAATPAAADEVTGEILAYDRLANILVFTDKTVWQLGDLMVPGDLAAGDTVTLVFTSDGDSGIKKAGSLTRTE